MSRRRTTNPSVYPANLHTHVVCMKEILLEPPNRGMPEEPSQLLDHVFLGCQSQAESLKILRKYNITHVLNCAGYKGPRPEPHASPYVEIGIEYLEFQADDYEDYDITQHFSEAFQYLDQVKRLRGNALVHCALGINRSAATCLAYIMHHQRKTLFEATRMIKRKRKVALTNRGFQVQLVKFAKSHGLLDKHAETEEMRLERKQEEEDKTWRKSRTDEWTSPRDTPEASRFDRLPPTSSSLYCKDSSLYAGEHSRDPTIRHSRHTSSRSPGRDPISSMMRQVLNVDDGRRRRDPSRGSTSDRYLY